MVVERPTSKVFVSILQVGESTATYHGCTAKMECNAAVAAMQRGKRSIEHRAETNAGRWKCIASESIPPIDFELAGELEDKETSLHDACSRIHEVQLAIQTPHTQANYTISCQPPQNKHHANE